MRGNAPNELAADLEACNNYRNGKIAAAAIKAPVQVIVAGKDRMAPRAATAELIQNLNKPDVALIPDSGHMLPQEAPNECRALLKAFVFSNNPSD